MLLMAKTTTNLWDSPLHHHQREDSIRYHRGFLSFKQSSRISRVSPDTGNSCTTIKASGSLNQTTNQPKTGYNTQILKFCELGNLKMAMELLCKSQKSELDLAAYCSILQLCADVKSLNDGQKIRSVIDSSGVEIDNVLGPKLVFMYVKCGDLREGRRVFDKIANDKVFLWNLLINEYAKNGNFEQGISLYGRMQKFGVEANSYTFSCVLKCFAAKESVVEGEMVHGYLLKLGFGSYNAVVNSLIAFYFKCGRTESARKLFDELRERDVISWNSMISGYVANSLAEKGFEIFIEMLNMGVTLDLATIVVALAACANIGTIVLGRALHAYAIKTGFNKECTFKNTLLDVYSKCGDIGSATQVFQHMGERSVVSWTSMIAGYARDGLSDKAITLFHEMKRNGVKPDIFTVTSILHACACSNSLENGKEVHDYIRENKMPLNLSISNALMDMYAKCGSMEDANSIFSQMPIKDIVSWNTMIGGYSKNSLPNEAFNLFFEMQSELKPDNVTMTCIIPSSASLAALDRGREIHGHVLRNGLSSDRYVANALVDIEKLAMAFGILSLPPGKTLRVTKNLRVCGDCHEMAKFMSKTFGREIVLRDSNRFHHFKDGCCSCRGYW
ncbi:pentatricopeptide repeat (PPR) superfamily protein [Actinidia rufa]|uniref:Pentatricopeptide repeat (PPR) superfamily protein n=1 Tax=Actinidia rufa TaxID=165716 RepID=A0A7J0ERJ7_9ERIC|nr:pentatricopeptide repeat (PPR) superfamily protein [Actinidia rufa]